MIKQLFILFFIVVLPASLFAQDIKMDAKKIEAGRAKPDSNYVAYLLDLSNAYSNNIYKNDSAEVLLIEARIVAEKIGYTKGLLSVNNLLSQYYYTKGKLSAALSVLLKNEATAIAAGDSAELFNTLRVVVALYMKIGDINMARESLKRRQYILDNNGIKGLKDTSYSVLSQYNSLATFYSLPQINKPDSVEYFYRKLYSLGKNTAQSSLWDQLGNGGLGLYFSTINKYDSSVYYYKIAMTSANKAKRFDNYYGFIYQLAKAYQQSDQSDSAFFYGYKVFNGAKEYSYLPILASSSDLLGTLYNKQHRYDSAVKYMTFGRAYKDSISGQETLNTIQFLTNEQQMKELEKQREKEEAIKEYKSALKNWYFVGGLLLLLLIIGFMYRTNKQRTQSKKKIEIAYNDLKATQAQLIQSEKMASLGELTAGIAHEIQNPLNFVNNFSEVNKELIEELKAERKKPKAERDEQSEEDILNDIGDNSGKINHHGKRAGDIVKGMLQHSRLSTGVKEPTDINALADEYLRLSYHGLRAKDKSFNAEMKTDFDETVGKINIIPQDIGRVLLNLFNNAFYATRERQKAESLEHEESVKYNPSVTVRTFLNPLFGGREAVIITVSDNGNGIPQKIVDKIFQPFFTTKPTGQGTGLGLSLSYDIIKAHGGEIKVESLSAEAVGKAGKEGEGTKFIIQLPVI